MTDRQSGDPPSSSDLGSPDCAYDILQILGVAIPAMCGGILFVFFADAGFYSCYARYGGQTKW